MQASKYEGGPISNVNLFFFMIAIFQDGVFWQFWEGASGIFFGCLRGRNKAPFPMEFR